VIRARTWRGIVLLGALAVLFWQLGRQPEEAEPAKPSKPDTRLNYALYDFSGRLLDDDGAVLVDLKAPVLRNDADSGIGTVEAPEIHVQAEQDRWYITAETAIVSPDRKNVDLSGAVNMTRHDARSDQVLEIETSNLRLALTPRTARTDAGVRILERGDWLQATGMRVDMINETYELLHDVRARYQSP